jgi:hypothetical protein
LNKKYWFPLIVKLKLTAVKKSFLFTVILCVFVVIPSESQGLLNKVKSAVSKEILGTSDKGNPKPGPEPPCACDNAKQIADLTQFKIDYREMAVSVKDDGKILVKDRIQNKYYIIDDGKSSGPFQENDPRVKAFDNTEESNSEDLDSDGWARLYPGYITKAGDKYMIKFNGKSYGPYAVINDFAVSMSKEKFAAVITENVLITDDQGKKMEEEMAKAKTDQERMEITIKFSQQMNQAMSGENGMEAFQPKLVSNIPGAVYNAMNWQGGRLNSKMKLDDIYVTTQDKIIDLQGNNVVKLDKSAYLYKNLFVNSSNNGYASYEYGTLTFSNNSKLTDLFNPYLTRSGGKVFLTYMYYSPGKNSIMQCAMDF